MFRRLVGVALAAAMVYLNIERADVVCADHSHKAPQTAPMDHTHTGHHHMSAADAGTTASQRNCETPAQRDCCQALVSCSIVLGSDEARHAAAPATEHATVIIGAERRPASRTTAPDPPPPRA